MKKKLKTIFLIVLVILVVGVVANYFLSKGTPAPSTSSLSSSAKAGGVAVQPGQQSEFAVLLSTINSINIDTSVFKNPSYLSLRDYPVSLGTDTIGRPNPFAPIGTDTVDGTVVAAPLQFQTLQPGKITSTSAEFGGQGIVVSDAQTNVIFEYGTNDLFGSATPPVSVGKNGTSLFTVTGLTPNTTYYVRAILVQGSNTTQGNTMTFTTLSSR